MKKALLFCFLLLTSFVSAQDLLMDTEDVHPADVIEPKFNGGGIDEFYAYINKEFDFSKVTKKGNITATFTITVTGEIADVRIVRYLDDASAAELIRVLRKAPKWESAKRGGEPFAVKIRLPLDFK